jgi:hypothetical protein
MQELPQYERESGERNGGVVKVPLPLPLPLALALPLPLYCACWTCMQLNFFLALMVVCVCHVIVDKTTTNANKFFGGTCIRRGLNLCRLRTGLYKV